MKLTEKIIFILLSFATCIAAGIYAVMGIAWLVSAEYIIIDSIVGFCSIVIANVFACQAENIIKGVFI